METGIQQAEHRLGILRNVPPSGGSLEIGNFLTNPSQALVCVVPPSGGSLEIGNAELVHDTCVLYPIVPPSGGSLEIGNSFFV